MRADEREAGKALDRWVRIVQTSKAVADAALSWWEDHDRKECHFCTPIERRTLSAYREIRHEHDEGCPLIAYVEALEEQT